MNDVTIECRGLTKRFGARTAVHELSFSARRGEVIGLLGRNGAGKTTTIRLLTTVLSPTSGEFSVDGATSARPADIRRRVGVLAESAGYPSQQSGEGYLRYHARLFGLPRDEAANVARRLLTEVGLEDRASSLIATYSRGMRQRLGIARALVNDPAVVFLDEPTLGLDPAGQRQMLAMVREIAKRRGATVVFSTHTLPEVEAVCSSLLILENGRILMSGTVADVTRVVALPRTARLRVPLERMEGAMGALGGVVGVTADTAEEGPDVIRISAVDPAGQHDRGQALMNASLTAVVSAGVPVLSFEVEGARLSDAFLAVTQRGAE